jgi:hypothetical protein
MMGRSLSFGDMIGSEFDARVVYLLKKPMKSIYGAN